MFIIIIIIIIIINNNGGTCKIMVWRGWSESLSLRFVKVAVVGWRLVHRTISMGQTCKFGQ